MWGLLWKTIEWLVSWLKPPLEMEISAFSFDDVRNKPGDPVVFITAYPRRYLARLVLTNQSGRTTYLKCVALATVRGHGPKEGMFHGPLRFESHEFKRLEVIFPLDDDEEPTTGEFEIEVTPSVGRKSVERITL